MIDRDQELHKMIERGFSSKSDVVIGVDLVDDQKVYDSNEFVLNRDPCLRISCSYKAPFKTYFFEIDLEEVKLSEEERMSCIIADLQVENQTLQNTVQKYDSKIEALTKQMNSLLRRSKVPHRKLVFFLESGDFHVSSTQWSNFTNAFGKVPIYAPAIMWSLSIIGNIFIWFSLSTNRDFYLCRTLC